jgi:tetratricopeptide (TPR) repeat protein
MTCTHLGSSIDVTTDRLTGGFMAYVSQESICKTLITDANKAIKKGEFDQAERLYREALQRLENATGPVHPRIASVLLRLGDFYSTQQKYGEAEVQFRRAMGIYQETFGDENLDIAICLQHLSDVLEAQGRGEEAGELRTRSKRILSERLSNFGMQSLRKGN